MSRKNTLLFMEAECKTFKKFPIYLVSFLLSDRSFRKTQTHLYSLCIVSSVVLCVGPSQSL